MGFLYFLRLRRDFAGEIGLGVPHFPIGLDVGGGIGEIDSVVMAAEGFEEGEAFRDAGAIEEVVEGVFDLADRAHDDHSVPSLISLMASYPS